MTISTNPTRSEYTATAGQTTFAYTFKIFEDTDLNVYVTPVGQEPDDTADIVTPSSVTDVGETAGGTVVIAATSAGDLVTIVSDIPESRVVDYQNNGDFRPDTVNADFDRVVSLSKQANDNVSRTLSFQESQQGAEGLTLDIPEGGKLLRWKADESGVENLEITTEVIAYVESFDSIADLKASISSYTDGQVVSVLGYNTSGDGGGQPLYWDTASIEADNGFTVFKATAIATGRFKSIDISALNAKHAGAVGDGAADDSDEVNTAISVYSGLGGVLNIPAGTYDFTSSTLDLLSDTHVKGAGIGVTILDNISTATVSSLSNVIFEGITFDNCGQLFILTTCSNFKFINCEFICIAAGGNRAVQTYSSTDFEITGCRFQDFQYGVWLKDQAGDNNLRFTFSDCTFESFIDQSFPAGINIMSGEDVNISNCIFKDITPSGVTQAYAIYQGDNTVNVSNNINISNIIARNTGRAVRIHNANNVNMVNINAVESSLGSILIDGDVDPITADFQENISISGGTMDGDIRLTSAGAGAGLINATVSGVTIADTDGYGVFVLGDGTAFVENVSIVGNTIRNAKESGIAINYGINITVVGNTITDCNTDDGAASTSDQIAGIVYVTTNHTLTSNNTIINTPGGSGHMKYGISYASSFNNFPNHVYYNNYMQGIETTNFRNSYTVAPTAGVWTQGTEVDFPTSGVVSAPKTRCTQSGTFSTATDSTGDTDGATAIITGLTDTSDFAVRDWVSVSAGFAGTGPYLILALSATTMTLNVNSDAVVANITVATIDPVFNDYVDLAP